MSEWKKELGGHGIERYRLIREKIILQRERDSNGVYEKRIWKRMIEGKIVRIFY